MQNLKFFILESIYDTIAKKISKIALDYVKESLEDYDEEIPDIYDTTIYYDEFKIPLEIIIDRTQIKKLGKKGFYINGWVMPSLKPKKISLEIYLNRNLESKIYSKIYSELIEVVRHEIQHLTQGGKYQKHFRPKTVKKPKIMNRYEYSKSPDELDALSYGFFSQAKHERVPIANIIKRNLDLWLKEKEINKEQYKDLFKCFVEYIKKNISSAKF